MTKREVNMLLESQESDNAPPNRTGKPQYLISEGQIKLPLEQFGFVRGHLQFTDAPNMCRIQMLNLDTFFSATLSGYELLSGFKVQGLFWVPNEMSRTSAYLKNKYKTDGPVVADRSKTPVRNSINCLNTTYCCEC